MVEGVIRVNIDTSLIDEDVVIILPVGEMRLEGCRNIFQRQLEMLEHEGVRLRGVRDMFVELCINEVNEERVREEDNGGII